MKFTIKNPIDNGWFADPEARIYEGQYVIYATVSLPFDEQKNQVCWTSKALTHWTSHDNNVTDGNGRFMCLDVMEFGEDGNIKPIRMTKHWEYEDGKVTVIE
ncbi:MAG: hypothetical protein IKY33_03115 [Clostridia bacterium]|nr:hypothetical protein [Clostridia bacterium]